MQRTKLKSESAFIIFVLLQFLLLFDLLCLKHNPVPILLFLNLKFSFRLFFVFTIVVDCFVRGLIVAIDFLLKHFPIEL